MECNKTLRELTNKKYTGEYISYHNDGIIKAKYNFINGRKNGVCIFYYKSNENVRKEINYVNNIKHGIYREFYHNGSLKIEQHYANGKLNGNYKEFNYNEKINERDNAGDTFSKYNKGGDWDFDF